jgi:hypothetical protein
MDSTPPHELKLLITSDHEFGQKKEDENTELSKLSKPGNTLILIGEKIA